MKFKTQYNGRVRRFTNVGNHIHNEYVGSVDDKGRVSLKPAGKTDTYAKIQSFKDSCDINLIVKRFNAGDTSVLNRVQGFYGDVTQMPSNYLDLLNVVEDSKRKFEQLPVDVRDVFGQNFSLYMNSVFDGSYVEKMRKAGFIKDAEKTDPKVSESEKGTD